MELSIIIVNYKSRAKLLNCLDSITKADLKNISYEIIVVDNASGDDLSGLSDSYPLRLIMSPKNLGMGGGNNLGINEARGEYILVLNPDTVVNAAAISELLNYLKGNAASEIYFKD